MSTYSVQNINIDNEIVFSPGKTAGTVLTANSDGTTYWGVGSSGESGTSGTSGTSGANGISSGQVYYFNESEDSDVSGYKVLSTNPSTASQQTVTTNLTGDEKAVMINDYITPQLGFSVIPGGVQRFHTHLLKEASNDDIEYYVEIQLADSSGTPIGPTVSSGKALIGWVDASTPAEVTVDVTLPTMTIDPTNRMIVKLYLDNNESSAKSIVYYTEGTSYYSFVVTSVGVISSTSGTSGTSGPTGATGSTGTSGTSGSTPNGSFGITIDGGGSAITTGLKGYITLPYDGTITGWDILADQSGSIVIDVWKDTYATFPPSVADTIAGSEKPTLSSAQKNQDNALSTWTTSVSAGDIIAFNVNSATTVTRVTLSIKITRI